MRIINHKQIIYLTVLSALITLVGSQTVFGSSTDVFRGWFWNAVIPQDEVRGVGLGWVSNNCVDDFDFDQTADYRCDNQTGAASYGLDVVVNGILGADDDDYVTGCAWSDQYGWICFNSEATYCPASPPNGNANINAACGSLNSNGVRIKTLEPNVLTLAYTEAADFDYERAVVLSLAEAGSVERGHIKFPYSSSLPVAGSGLSGPFKSCINCRLGACASCLEVANGKGANDNYLFTQCTGCTIAVNGGSCASGHQNDNTCTSCVSYYEQPGVVVNYPKTCRDNGAYCTVNTNCANTVLGCDYANSKAELCGWGYNAWDSGNGAAWPADLSDWDYRIKLTVDKDKVVSSSYSRFPVYVDLSSFPASFFNNVHIDSGKTDIRVTDADGNSLLREVILDDLGKPAELYFNTLSLFSGLTADAEFYIYYGNPSGTSVNDGGTWRPAYLNVLHLDDDPTGGVFYDSRSTPRNATPAGPVTAEGFEGRGAGISFDGIDDKVTLGSIGPYQNFTIEGWLKEDTACTDGGTAPVPPGTTENGNCVLWSKDWNNWIFIRPDQENIIFNDPSPIPSEVLQAEDTPSNLNTWVYVTVVRSGLVISYYRNGVLVPNGTRTLSQTPAVVNFSSSLLGYFTPTWKLTGLMDEFRISSAALSPEWIATQYNNMHDPSSFYDISEPVDQNTAAGISGLGWIAFNPLIEGAALPYTKAEAGNIYSRGQISSDYGPPLGSSNAAYLIDAKQGINKWTSSSADFPTGRTGVDITFPDSQGQGSSLGLLDIAGLITDVTETGINKYGSNLVNSPNSLVSPTTINGLFSNALKDQVFLFDDDPSYTVSGGTKTVYKGAGTSGAGVIYVAGDLYINNNIVYDTSGIITRRSQIPSLVWIVQGDVYISPLVTEVAGTFIVLGDGSSCPSLPSDAANHCGKFSTGDDSGNATQLTVRGNVIARQIWIQRSYNENDEPAEIFVADGRLQANTPAGLSTFSSSLPRFSSGF